MHIVLANQWYPPESGWGGVAMWNYAMAHAYRSLGHDVTIVTSRRSVEIPALQEVGGIEVRRLLVRDPQRLRQLPGAGKHVRGVQLFLYSHRVAETLREIHRRKLIDVVEFAEVNAEGFHFARHPATPYVVRCHTPAFVLARYFDPKHKPYDTRLTGYLEKQFIRETKILTAPSIDMAKVIAAECQIPETRLEVIPNAVQVSYFDTRQHTSSSEVMILHVGRIETAKGVDVLTDAIPHVLESAPHVRFVFVGRDSHTPFGSKRLELEQRLAACGCSDAVYFAGAVEQGELRHWYERADLCVVPSIQYESFSYTCAQAMASGRPVIASRIGGMPETVGDGECGLIVEPGNAMALANAILELVRDPAARTRMGRAGRAKARQEFDTPVVAARMLSVYARAISAFAR